MMSVVSGFHSSRLTLSSVAPLLLAFLLQLPPAQHQRTMRASVSVTVAPRKATLFTGQKQRFTAVIVGTESTVIKWTVEEQEGGSISEDGVYTAPKTIGIYHVIATSEADPGAKAVATVTVITYYDPPFQFNRLRR